MKNKQRCYTVLGILFILFTLIAFVLPVLKNLTFWFGYVFGVIAIVAQIYFLKTSFENGNDARSKFYGFPIARVGFIYLVVQVLISIIEIALASKLMSWIAVIADVIVLAFAVIGCISAETMRDEIERQDTALRKKVNKMRSLQSFSLSIVGMSTDRELTAELQKVADEFKYSDPVSSDDTIPIEIDLDSQLKEIQAAVVEGDSESAKKLCKNILVCLAERNRLCKLEK